MIADRIYSLTKSTTARSDTFLFSDDSFSAIEESAILDLAEYARKSSARICLHPDGNSDLHNMVIAHPRGIYIRPHANPKKSKAYHAIEGAMRIIGIDNDGSKIFDVLLGKENVSILRIQKGVFLLLLPITDVCVFHEIALGPFCREEDTVFADFAPDGSNEHEIKVFIKKYTES